MNFRLDINGLRAWAVVPVVLFHFEVAGFGGGFVGVDVFFVISGFLMTSIILMGLERTEGAEFSVWRFYLARALRIWPALLAVCALLMLLGVFGLTSIEYQVLAKHVVSSLLFYSNQLYWREVSYFDADAHDKWLLHTWSLSVEWQFYLVLPLVLMLIWRITHSVKVLHAVLWLGAVLSFGAALVLLSIKPSFAFYALPPRAWEMFAGGLVYMHSRSIKSPHRLARWAEPFGWLLIISSVLALDARWQWPGWLALWPVSGACLVLAAANPTSFMSTSPVAQWIGSRSYSIYLWHWPVVVAMRYADVLSRPLAVLLCVCVTVLLAMASHRWVETWGRERLALLTWRGQTSVLVVGSAVMALVAVWVSEHAGLPQRLPSAIEHVAAQQLNIKPRRAECLTTSGTTSPSCMYGGNQLGAVLLGDSHADAVTTALAGAAPSGAGVMDLSYTGCPTLFDVKYVDTRTANNKGHQCAAFQRWVESRLQALPSSVPLVIVNRATAYAFGPDYPFDGSAGRPVFYFDHVHEVTSPEYLAQFAVKLTESICRHAARRQVYVVKPLPEMDEHVPKFMARGMILGQQRHVARPLAEHLRRHAVVLKAYEDAQRRCGVRLLDPYPVLCPAGLCQGEAEGMPLYYDDDHLNELGNKRLVPIFRAVFERRNDR